VAKYERAEDAVACIKSGQRVFIHGGVATPERLIDGLLAHAGRLRDVELIHIHTEGKAKYANPEFKDSFKIVNLFVGSNIRKKVDYDRVDYLPCFLHEIPQLFRSGKRPINVALIHVSPPDPHGFCTLGVSVDVARAAVEVAEVIIAQVNQQMPRVHGDGFIHMDEIDHFIEIDEPLMNHIVHPLKANEKAIGRFAAELIEDGATLQMGIGAIPDAVLDFLTGHKHLGVHTELMSDGVLRLIKAGAVDNSKKKVHPGKTVSGFMMGTRELYDYVHNNPSMVQLDIGYVNDPAVIRRNPKVTAINSAVEVDLTGQVCADSIGPRIISGVGGQTDFMRGASLSPGGKPIIAITSRSEKGFPRIVPMLKHGSGVVTTRAHVHYVITEFGAVDLYGKTLSERAKALISIAHPDDREGLARAWRDRQEGKF